MDPSPERRADDSEQRDERDALYRALVEIAGREGYSAATPAVVAHAAGLPAETFYEHFDSIKECFLVVHADTLSRLVEEVAAAVDRSAHAAWPRQLAAGFEAALAFLARDPDLTRACLLEAGSVGFEAEARAEATLRRLIACVEALREPPKGDAPPLEPELLVRGTHALLRARVERGEVASLPELLPELQQMWRGGADPNGA